MSAGLADAATGANTFTSRADAIVKAYSEAERFSGTVLVAKDGRTIFQKSYGLANREWNVPARNDAHYRIGSVTKQFTAAAALQLVERGKLGLDDPVGLHFKEAPPEWAKVTVRHLLTHTSGIPPHPSFRGAFASQSKRDWTPEEIVGLSVGKPLAFAPGSRFAYNNTGYDLLGLIIERISGQPYAAYVRDNVLTPAGLANTRCDVSADVLPRRASGYSLVQNRLQTAPYVSPSLLYSAGCLYSTANDLLAWDQALHAGKVLTQPSVAEMFRDQGFRYGLGVFVQNDHGHRQWGHGGGLPGFAAMLSRYPDDGLTVIVLSNLEQANAMRMASLIGQAYFNPMIADGPAGALRKAERAAYIGRYRLPSGPVIEVSEVEEGLVAGLAGQPKSTLVREIGRSFFLVGSPFQISFSKGDPAPTLVLHQDLADTAAQRIP